MPTLTKQNETLAGFVAFLTFIKKITENCSYCRQQTHVCTNSFNQLNQPYAKSIECIINWSPHMEPAWSKFDLSRRMPIQPWIWINHNICFNQSPFKWLNGLFSVFKSLISWLFYKLAQIENRCFEANIIPTFTIREFKLTHTVNNHLSPQNRCTSTWANFIRIYEFDTPSKHFDLQLSQIFK